MDTSIGQLLSRTRLLPIVVGGDVRDPAQLSEVLLSAHLPVVEVALRSADAGDLLRDLGSNSSLTVGSGTVLNSEQVAMSADAGASFAVSPGFDRSLVEQVLSRGMVPIPGVATPSELQAAYSLGLRLVKFFPAAEMGGPRMVRALAAPFGDMMFLPTGGVGSSNLVDYLSLPMVLAVGGSWIVAPHLLEAEDWEGIRERARQAVEAAQRVTESSSCGGGLP